jgi:hypothetical protein
MPAVHCETCGTVNAPGARICVGCGRSLATAGGSGDAWPPPPGEPVPPPGATSGEWPPPSGQTPPPGPTSGDWPPPPGPAATPEPTSAPPGFAGAPPGTPPGAPPGYAPMPLGEPPAPPQRNRSNVLLIAAVFVVVALVAAAAFVVVNRGGDDDGDEVVLEPIDLVQEDDFAGNWEVGGAAGSVFSSFEPSEEVPDDRVEQLDATLAGHTVDGSAPAVYGGSRDSQVCDMAGLVSFLTDPANSGQAGAWAAVHGIETADIESYLGTLTAVRLRWDTRVTNHGYSDGEATPFQSLLQAGTAVLVDDTGVPRVKCNCGNPLLAPAGLGDASGTDAMDLDAVAQNPDDAWEGMDPAQAVTITPGEQPMDAITLVDVDGGGMLDRPVGSDGASRPDVGFGDVQLTLTWASNADLDLAVTEPDGTQIWFSNKGPTTSGGQLDVDSNVGCDNDGSVENIFWPTGQSPPSGTYTVTVTGYQVTDCGDGGYTLDMTVGGTVTTESGTVGEDEVQDFTFEVP